MKTFKILALLLVSIFTTSCFDIVEQIKLKTDGSGNYKLIVNLSKSKDQIKGFLKKDSINGIKIPSMDSINTIITHVETTLKKQKGISNVQITRDSENFKYTISYDFINASTLNIASNQVLKQLLKKNPQEWFVHFKQSGKSFERKTNEDLFTKLKSKGWLVSQVFSSANFISIIDPPGAISYVSAPEASKTKNGAAVIFRKNIKSILNSPNSTQLKVTWK